MADLKEARVPDIGGHDGVPVIELLVAVGDTVTLDQGLVTLESDKATMEVPAPFAGTVREIKVKVGDKVGEGALVAMIEPAEAAAGAPPAGPSSEAMQPGKAPAQVATSPSQPRTSETPERVEPVAPSGQPDNLAQRDIASHAGVSAVVAQASTPGLVGAAHAAMPAIEPRTPPVTFDASELMPDTVPYASPAVRLFARELGVDLSHVKGSAKGGRITRDDVQGHVKQVMSGAAAAPSAGGSALGGGLNLLPWPKVDFAKFGAVEVREMSRIKKLSGANLARNWAMIPHVTQHDDADITDLEALRIALNKENEKTGTKVTMLAFLMKAVVAALKKYPDFNASLDATGENLVLKKYFHVGFAADTPNGLVVPVIRDVDRKGVVELAQETSELATKARDGKLGPADMSGGCFSISSLGGIGGTSFTPIVNAPEVAILGVSKSAMKPVWDGSAFQPRLILPLSLSYDHRVIDGASAARFTSYLAQLMADMRRVLL
ncbi:dihydrolipoyllysine-residue acetyltransferase [Cognatilysobacter lacus]|uniref:Dihydrolipoamide acetyltransferase component of pyruvate dehydrogenase complex n=1 Tax=Cognatilysobacter lacus TaxID=1643323 RepID=A0A5D8Z607_9GAMM|nr:dihydrolipoyllysine-residue acetyltransferase [Lysobacter lacus]TZF90425.1 dihydrolipoyllysine-residue acetyltransferase [Lysobacter lacus]